MFDCDLIFTWPPTFLNRTLPLFVWHRQNWNIIYPWLELEEKELSDLSSHGTYVAGFTDPAIEGRTDLYDLFVNGQYNVLGIVCIKLCII